MSLQRLWLCAAPRRSAPLRAASHSLQTAWEGSGSAVARDEMDEAQVQSRLDELQLFLCACTGVVGACAREKEELLHAWSKICADLRYLAERAAADWRPGFREVISKATSFRIATPRVSMNKDEREHRCVGCGRLESRNKKVVDLAGPVVHYRNWLEDDVGRFRGCLADFMAQYQAADAAQLCDLGSYALGECCTRKAAIFFQFATLPLLHAYDATVLENEGEEAGSYAASEENVSEALRLLDDLKRCLTDDKLKPPPVATDALFWERVDEARAEAAGADEERRLYDALERGERCCRDGVDASRVEVSESHVHRKRKRRAVVRDSDDDDGDGGEESDFVVEEEGGDEGAGEDGCFVEVGEEWVEPERVRRRRSPAAMVQGMRARDRVPARRRTVSMLFDLASRLSQEERDDDAALVGNAAATILELMDRALA